VINRSAPDITWFFNHVQLFKIKQLGAWEAKETVARTAAKKKTRKGAAKAGQRENKREDTAATEGAAAKTAGAVGTAR